MRKRSSQGYMTVEAAIVFPVIFFCLLGILYYSVIYYQNTMIAAASIRAAGKASYYWDSLGGDGAWGFQLTEESRESMNIGDGALAKHSFTQHDPYRYFFDTRNADRERNIKAYVNWLLGENPDILGGEETTGDPQVRKSGGILQKYVEVRVTKTYINPFGNLLERMGLRIPSEHTITARAPLNNPTEFIRNVSFIYDLVKGRGG